MSIIKVPVLKWKKQIYKDTITLDNGKTQVIQTVTIGIEDMNTGLFLVSPITGFINDIYLSKKTTTQVAAANVVVSFLNYIYFICNKTLDDIEYQDAIDFLNIKDVKRDTKDTYAHTLTKFYKYLHIHNYNVIPPKWNLENFQVTGYNTYTTNTDVDVIHNIKTEYLPLFLQCAKDVAPDIALGVFLELFGGLRCSEVVSLEYSNIQISNRDSNIKTMFLNLYDKDLRPDLSTAFIAKVKRNRRQEVIPAFGSMLFDLYETHKTIYKSKNTQAIFIDANGNPMTDKTYVRRFNKIKKEFIKRLSESNDINAKSYAVYLSSYKWSTHICRGVFSNLIAENSNNISEIAAWRGDTSLSSSLSYLNDNQVVTDKVLKVLNEIYKGDK